MLAVPRLMVCNKENGCCYFTPRGLKKGEKISSSINDCFCWLRPRELCLLCIKVLSLYIYIYIMLLYFLLCDVRYRTKEKHLSLSSMDAAKGD
jgi:hypothetical protein